MTSVALTFDEEAALKRVRDCGALAVPEYHNTRQMFRRLASWGYITIDEANTALWRVSAAVEDSPASQPPPEELVRELLAQAGPETVARTIRQSGYEPIPIDRLKRIRADMVSEGSAEALQSGGSWVDVNARYHDESARHGSERLAEKINALYLREAEKRHCSVEAVTLILNYSPAQIQKMAA